MNGTRRGLNRVLLGAFGLVLIALGALAVLAGTGPDFAKAWTRTGTGWWARIQDLLASAKIPGQDISWWTLAVMGLLLVAGVLLVCWIASQGGGRTKQLCTSDDDAGTTTVETAVAGQAIKAALADNKQVLSTAVQAWELKGGSGLRISLQARKGASPRELMAVLDELVGGLDVLLGEEIPVLIRIKAGTRSRFARTERVT
ncbi:hypothetical protein CVV68_00955 [Arthrobacter livingstonensis]|uniref:Alkaline shock response membrane anchor protein AmaP n=1 Tax=Arthrobacter livingstonensis TaxID=670078 RepID=A0A2V5LDZ5_9MICC|nr:hypothetical protein [Arthrobacter livingstonensis]PYI69708.1 hypothetical protein CVV68_00955 [Arthrobacter livingstonensis]